MTDEKSYNQRLIEEFRDTGGQPGGRMRGRPLLLLTTTGAKSGSQHTTPLMFIADGHRLLVAASNGGASDHPHWYFNLVAHPDVTVEVGNETFETTAVVVQEPARQPLWDKLVALHPFFGEYQAKVSRQIPLIALEKKSTV